MRRIIGLAATLLVILSCSVYRKHTQVASTAVLPGTGGATIEGVVMYGGAPVPGVTVTMGGDAIALSAISDATGHFRFVNVSPGLHTLGFELTGFQRLRVRVRAVPGKAVQLRTELPVAAVAESITVTAAAPSMNQSGVYVAVAAPPPPPKAARGVVGGVIGGVLSSAPQGMAFGNPAEIETPSPDYASLPEHGFIETSKQAVTTFAIDVDRASYANVRRFLNAGQVPPPEAVRVEEMLNYFTWSYPQPNDVHPFSVTTEVASCPWAPDHRLLRIGVQGRNLEQWRLAPNNLVFLVDVSGSMQPPARLPLIKSGLRLLVEQLRAEDRVAIVVYAGAAGLVLPSTSGADKKTILDALERLNAGGSTAGAAGIQLAYEAVRDNFIAGGNNRVILATDGDFNVGVTSNDELLKLIDEKRKGGIYLTTIGVGDDNYHDARLEMLADHGDGNYAYLDGIKEAEKVFVHELTGTLVTIAKDVKVQLEFDPARVASYRQIGYENRALANKDFDDDAKDAGELGAGHSVTALYEIVPTGGATGTVATLKLRYKQPAGTTSQLLAYVAEDRGRNIYEASPDLQFAAAIAEFGMLLRRSAHSGTATYADAVALARASRGVDLDGTREEFLRLLDASRALTGEAPPRVAGR